jgi:hypothetical protein
MNPSRWTAANPAHDRARYSSAMSVNGTKQTSISTLNMSAFGGKADISHLRSYVR